MRQEDSEAIVKAKIQDKEIDQHNVKAKIQDKEIAQDKCQGQDPRQAN